MNETPTELRELRHEIDSCDETIAETIAERIAIAEDVARVKADHDRELVDEDREAAVKSHFAELFRERGLEAEDGKELAEFLISLSLERETEIEDRP